MKYFYYADPAEGAMNSSNLLLVPSARDAEIHLSFIPSQ